MPISWMRTLGLRENTNRAVPALLCVGSGWALGRPACGAAAPGAWRTGGLAAAAPEQAPGSPAAGQSVLKGGAGGRLGGHWRRRRGREASGRGDRQGGSAPHAESAGPPKQVRQARAPRFAPWIPGAEGTRARGVPGKPRASSAGRLGRGRRVGFAGAQSRATGAVRGNPAPRADLGSFSLTCPHLCAAGRAGRGEWKMWAPRSLGDRSCLLKFQETKQTFFSPFLTSWEN